MQKTTLSIIFACALSMGSNVYAQTTVSANLTSPTEVGKTTMPPGQYLMREVNTGKQYTLTISDKGTMIFGPVNAPAPASAAGAPAKSASGVEGLAQKEIGNYIQKQGMSQIKKFMK